MHRTIEMINQIVATSQLESKKRSKSSICVDRLRQATGSSTLMLAINKLSELMQTETQFIRHDVFKAFCEACSDSNANSVLQFLREQPQVAVMIATLKEEAERKQTASIITLKDVSKKSGAVAARHNFDITIRGRLQSPLAHGADTKAGNATLFRRMQVMSPDGDILNLPFYAGNALRGNMRDMLADHFISSLGLSPRRDTPPIALWLFYVIYSGGALEEASKATALIQSKLGNDGVLNCSGVAELRNILPVISALGAALGNRIIAGRAKFADLRPVCKEWGNGGTASVDELFDWTYLTRREDCEDHIDNHSMIANTEVIRTGIMLEGGIDFDGHASELEKSVIAKGLELLKKSSYIGAESRRGFGKIALEFTGLPDSTIYENYLKEKKDDILKYLTSVGAFDLTPAEKTQKKKRGDKIDADLDKAGL